MNCPYKGIYWRVKRITGGQQLSDRPTIVTDIPPGKLADTEELVGTGGTIVLSS